MGRCGGKEVRVLIDSGSNNNFISPSAVARVKLKQTSISGFKVGTGSGVLLSYSSKCERVALKIQGNEFVTDLFFLEIKGSDIVLGVQWLMELGPIVTNYKDLTMEFNLHGQQIRIQGEDIMRVAPLKGKAFNKLMIANTISECFQLQVIEKEGVGITEGVEKKNVKEELKTVLQQYYEVFEEPKSLPPVREIDHRIPLDLGAEAVIIRPYRYPQFQKAEIERLVNEIPQ